MVREIPHVEGVRHVFLDLNGIRVHVAEAGPADASPAILLHGWPQHWYMWRRVIGALQADFRLLTKGNGRDAFLDAEVNEFADSLREPARADAVSRLYRYYLKGVQAGSGRALALREADCPSLDPLRRGRCPHHPASASWV